MKKFLISIVVLIAVIAAAGLYVTRPKTVDPARFANLSGDVAAGERIYYAAGCGSCHAAPGSDDKLVLAGGKRFETPYGAFIAPNISMDTTQGIGAWSQLQFASAVLEGTSPEGSHYFPAFPYTTYTRMQDHDVADLWAFMQTLPASDVPSVPHEIGFPYNIRLGIGGWKLLYVTDAWALKSPESDEIERGRYLVEAMGHCAECHTPRNAVGAHERDRWMAGAPNPSGKGRIPGLTPAQLDWSAGDIAYYLETGFTPDFDSAGGGMVDVIDNTSKLSSEDRAAMAAYLKALPARE